MPTSRKGKGQQPSEPPQEPRLRVSREEARQKLTEQFDIGTERRNNPPTTPDLQQINDANSFRHRWEAYVETLLKKLFDTDGPADEFRRKFGMAVDWRAMSFQKVVEWHHREWDYDLNHLRSIIERLDLYDELPSGNQGPIILQPSAVAAGSRKVFVVHGHNNEFKETAARFLERLGLEPIILHEQANAGQTLIEKLEKYGKVGFALVLLTADDIGAAKTQPGQLKPRARQNVILELGYFIGRLGREYVCALHEEGLEVPSDMHGVVYVPLDPTGMWKVLLAREIKAAGIEVDMNKAT